QVRGYISNGRNLVSVRLKRIGEPPSDEISVANQYPFFDPQPPQGTFLRADLHRGGLGIAWISSLAAGNQPRE
ncbi:MAG TPA: hypothetical protein VNO55_12755, partial [Polyangia bacterium]|nr:hypothetical protein [Polyangia bacterium]